MDFSEMSDKEKREKIKELENEIKKADMLYNQYKGLQLAFKLIINGTYGALAHPKFVVSNKHIANAITIHGRDVILYMLSNIENYFYNVWHTDTEVHKLLSETFIGVDEQFNSYMINIHDKVVGYPEKYSKELEEKGNEEKEKSAILNILKVWNISPEKLKKIEERKIIHNDKEITIKYSRKLHDFSSIRPIDGRLRDVLQDDGKTISPDREKMESYDTKFHNEDIIIYGDTDSTFSETIIRTDDGSYKIEELYNMNIGTGDAGKTLNGHESVKCSQKVLNWDEEKGLYYAPVKRIIRHKVTKAKWKLKTKQGKEIIVTNDHSMIVFRDGKKLEVKPCEILKTDKILIIKNNI